MRNTVKHKLCGGTFFTLLLRARKQRMGVREHYKGMSDGMADPILLMALAEIAIPDYRVPDASMMSTVKSTTSRYKSCQANGGTYFPFSDGSVIASFDSRIKNEYGRCLAAMKSYVADYIDVCGDIKKDEYLVKALVEVIDADDQIENGHAFYVCEDGSTLTKSEILSATQLCLQSFLLGIWHYIILNVQDNKVGADTYNRWCPSRGGAERVYVAMLGETSSRNNRSTSFFVIRKTDNKSMIVPCVKAGKTIGEKVNYNPVQNSYAALWDELKKLYEEEHSSIAIKNVSRRILDQYFLQLCGFDGADIRRTVLETNKHRFITEEGGKPNYEKYHLASALLHYVGSPSGIGDEMFIDDECLSSECHKAVFKLIFEAMEQDQHYKMMMGEV